MLFQEPIWCFLKMHLNPPIIMDYWFIGIPCFYHDHSNQHYQLYSQHPSKGTVCYTHSVCMHVCVHTCMYTYISRQRQSGAPGHYENSPILVTKLTNFWARAVSSNFCVPPTSWCPWALAQWPLWLIRPWYKYVHRVCVCLCVSMCIHVCICVYMRVHI